MCSGVLVCSGISMNPVISTSLEMTGARQNISVFRRLKSIYHGLRFIQTSKRNLKVVFVMTNKISAFQIQNVKCIVMTRIFGQLLFRT